MNERNGHIPEYKLARDLEDSVGKQTPVRNRRTGPAGELTRSNRSQNRKPSRNLTAKRRRQKMDQKRADQRLMYDGGVRRHPTEMDPNMMDQKVAG